MSNVNIRRAEIKDGSSMMQLIRELALYEKAPDEVTVTYEHFIESGFGANPVWWAWVAEIEGEIVGFALYYIRYSTWKGQRMYLEDIIVSDTYRGKGIGAGLMQALIQDAKEKQLKGIVWQVLEWNQPAIDFYKKYKARFDNEWVNVAIDV